MDATTPEPTHAELRAELTDALGRVQHALERLDRLEHGPRSTVHDLPGGPTDHPTTAPLDPRPALHAPDVDARTPSRRLLLGGAAAGTVAALAGAFGGAAPAAAVTGAMQFGSANDAGADSTLLTSTTNSQTFRAVNAAGGNAIAGIAESGIAVIGNSSSGAALRGFTTSGLGLSVSALQAVGALIASERVHLRLVASAARPAPTSDAIGHQLGDIALDGAGDLWLCTAAGTPGTWRKLSGPKTAGALHVLPAPVRVYDSRAFTQPAVGLKTPFSGGETRTIDCTVNSSSVPADATAVIVTCLIVNAVAGNGNFTIWADGQAKPNANTLVWGGTDGRASTLALSALGPNAKVKVTPSIKADVVIDVVGYHR